MSTSAPELVREKPALSQGRQVELPTRPLYLYLEHAAQRFPTNIWLSDAAHTVSFAAGLEAVGRVAQGLADIGVKPSDRVAICMPNNLAYPVLAYACWRLGAVVVGLNPVYAGSMLKRQIEDADAKLVVTVGAPEILTKVAEAAAGARLLVCAPDGSDFFNSAARAPDGFTSASELLAPNPFSGAGPNLSDLAALQYTGGTTGAPKGAMLSHGNISSCAEALLYAMPEFKPSEERFIALGPFAHIIGTTLILVTATAVAAEIIVPARFHPEETTRFCLDRGISVIFGVPTMFGAMAGTKAARTGDWSKLTYSMCGGAPLPAEVARAFEEVTGCRLLQGYGLSETASGAAFTPPSRRHPDGSVGGALANSTVEIRSPEDGALLLEGQIGEICINGPNIMQGYWRQPEATAAAMVGGVFHSGDTGYLRDGALFIVDRLKDLIIASGYNVYPRVVEDAIYTHPAVREAAVVGVKDSYRGETVKAVVSLQSGAALTLEELQSFLKNKLSPIEMPRLLEILPELPKTAVGKIAKTELR